MNRRTFLTSRLSLPIFAAFRPAEAETVVGIDWASGPDETVALEYRGFYNHTCRGDSDTCARCGHFPGKPLDSLTERCRVKRRIPNSDPNAGIVMDEVSDFPICTQPEHGYGEDGLCVHCGYDVPAFLINGHVVPYGSSECLRCERDISLVGKVRVCQTSPREERQYQNECRAQGQFQ